MKYLLPLLLLASLLCQIASAQQPGTPPPLPPPGQKPEEVEIFEDA